MEVVFFLTFGFFSVRLWMVKPSEVVMVYLTKRQREILEFVRSFQAAKGYAPSLEEIAAHFKLSAVSTVHEHLVNMSRKGILRRGWNRARSIEPMAGGEAREVPLVGTVAAGSPIEAVEVPENVALPSDLAGRGETFVLRVKGDSMMGDGILDGDLIVVEKRRRVENGALAVVLLRGGEATVKRFYHEGATVKLRPSNPAMEDIVAPAAEVEVRGVVVGLVRRYRRA
jgi:repressor LexA